jgi:hypothetical protein
MSKAGISSFGASNPVNGFVVLTVEVSVMTHVLRWAVSVEQISSFPGDPFHSV